MENQYDSLSFRIWRSIEKEDKTKFRLAQALIVKEDEYHENYDEINDLTKIVTLKSQKLNDGNGSVAKCFTFI